MEFKPSTPINVNDVDEEWIEVCLKANKYRWSRNTRNDCDACPSKLIRNNDGTRTYQCKNSCIGSPKEAIKRALINNGYNTNFLDLNVNFDTFVPGERYDSLIPFMNDMLNNMNNKHTPLTEEELDALLG